MAEFIERETALNLISDIFFKTDPDGEEQCGVIKCSKAIRNAPAADVVEVVHAYWDKDSITGAMRCSNCRMPPPGDAELEDFYESAYCQSCGAKMDRKG